MSIDGPVTCFAPFHNVNCPQGFLFFNKKVGRQFLIFLSDLKSVYFLFHLYWSNFLFNS